MDEATNSPTYGPAGKPSVGRMVHYCHWSNTGGIVISPATILRADVETGKCGLLVMNAELYLDENHPGTFRANDVPFSPEYMKLGRWSWAPVVR